MNNLQQLPKILQQLNGGAVASPLGQLIPKIRQAKAMLGAIQNPQLAINQILQSNPQINQVISQYGGVDGAINALCSQQGIPVNEFLDALK